MVGTVIATALHGRYRGEVDPLALPVALLYHVPVFHDEVISRGHSVAGGAKVVDALENHHVGNAVLLHYVSAETLFSRLAVATVSQHAVIAYAKV